MDKRDGQGSKPTPRVFKASDVHKRRAPGPSSRKPPLKIKPSKDEGALARAKTFERPAEEVARKDVGNGAGEAARADRKAVGEVQATQAAPQKGKPTPRFRAVKRDAAPSPAQRGASKPARQSESVSQDVSDDSASQEKTSRPTLRRGLSGASSRIARAVDFVRSKPKIFAGAAIALVIVLVACMIAFNRWGRFDDRADIQGTWYVYTTDAAIAIDGNSIRFNDQVAYQYSIDPAAKTITYTFGNMQGQGHYWFSDDRTYLVITDGSYSAAGATVEDLLHAFTDWALEFEGGTSALPVGKGLIALSRVPNETARSVTLPQPEYAQPSTDGVASGSTSGSAAEPAG